MPLVDLEPHLADAMLEALRVEGVAAYAAPSPGVSGPYLDVHLPDRPKDRLWVDAEARERASAVVRAALPRMQEQYEAGTRPASDEDAAWQAIVAGYDQTGVDPADELRPGAVSGQSRLLRRTEPIEVSPADQSDEADGAPREEDHYVPPPPPPLPQADAVTKLGWAAVIGGPAYLLFGTVTGHGLSEQGAVLAVLAFAAGFVTLVARMKERPPTDSGPDDGAVV
jgi:hypothetical protein